MAGCPPRYSRYQGTLFTRGLNSTIIMLLHLAYPILFPTHLAAPLYTPL